MGFQESKYKMDLDVEGKLAEILIGLKCPHCSDALIVHHNNRLVDCGHCGKPVYTEVSGIVRPFSFPTILVRSLRSSRTLNSRMRSKK